MLKAEQVPSRLAMIARMAFLNGTGPSADDDWNAAIAAAINAWPDLRIERLWALPVPTDGIILPLPQEPTND